MTANPSIEALSVIRKALDAGPTPGPWESDDTAVYLNGESGFDLFHAPAAKANAAFVAAANPEAIRTLLALVDAQEASKKNLIDALRSLTDAVDGACGVAIPQGAFQGLRNDARAAIVSSMKETK